jgi:hypothetical protein
MGLYGALVVSGTDYPTVGQEQVLVFSEIDPNINDDPAGLGARVSLPKPSPDVVGWDPSLSGWSPKHFLINGAAYDPANTPIAINVNQNVLLRFVNAGLETFVPTLSRGLYMDVIAEDGNLYPYALTQYGIELPAGKTMDAVINVGSEGTFALYDRVLHLANGGMVAKLQASAAIGAPVAMNDPGVAGDYTIAEDSGSLTTVAGGSPPGVLDNDTGAVAAELVSGPSSGTLAGGLLSDGSFTYTPNADFSGSDQFTYVANDGGSGPNSNVATATITVTPVNDAPVAAADGYDAIAGAMLSVAAPGVLGNDTDVDGNLLTAIPVGAPAGLTLNPNGSFDYTPAGAAGAVETFDYQACDAEPLCSTATVTITVVSAPTPVNNPPIAADDTTSIQRNTTLVSYNIINNDDDGEGNFGAPFIDPTSVVFVDGTTTQGGGSVVDNNDGTITYTPRSAGYRGTDTFRYTVDDADGATSNVATVRINVTR